MCVARVQRGISPSLHRLVATPSPAMVPLLMSVVGWGSKHDKILTLSVQWALRSFCGWVGKGAYEREDSTVSML